MVNDLDLVKDLFRARGRLFFRRFVTPTADPDRPPYSFG
jgi:hypothetical protein